MQPYVSRCRNFQVQVQGRTEGLLVEEGDIGCYSAGEVWLLLLVKCVVAQAQVHRTHRQ